MLVYGDRSEFANPQERLAALAGLVRAIAAMSSGIDRHATLVRALIEAGQLLQGVADQCCPPPQLVMLVHSLALCVVRSVDTHYRDAGDLPSVDVPTLPRTVELRLPEGFAFYGVYPEAYVEAARRLTLKGAPRVIGIRSIGTTLGAITAAAIGAPPALTVRPFGEPFARKVELPSQAIEESTHYIIVDEGPGLSGSSFGAVADWLEGKGVPLERIAFLPSHSEDPGPHASEAHRRRWHQAQRVPATFDDAFLEERFGPLERLECGGPWQRLKYAARCNGRRLLLKFAGLGATGETKLALARTLHAARLVPEPLGIVHGFLVERWVDEARPLDVNDRPVEEFGRYVAARARLLSAPPTAGATIEQLLEMCRRNIELGLGPTFSGAIDHFDAADLEPRVRRVRTDNKMQSEEWLRDSNEHLLKADALDHHQAHDLIGCQGVEWDIAGVAEEFSLSHLEEERLIGAAAINVDRELLEFYRIAYAAFRLGQESIGSNVQSAERYARSAAHLLHQYS